MAARRLSDSALLLSSDGLIVFLSLMFVASMLLYISVISRLLETAFYLLNTATGSDTTNVGTAPCLVFGWTCYLN